MGNRHSLGVYGLNSGVRNRLVTGSQSDQRVPSHPVPSRDTEGHRGVYGNRRQGRTDIYRFGPCTYGPEGMSGNELRTRNTQ